MFENTPHNITQHKVSEANFNHKKNSRCAIQCSSQNLLFGDFSASKPKQPATETNRHDY